MPFLGGVAIVQYHLSGETPNHCQEMTMNMLVRRAALLAVCTLAAFLQAAAIRADEKPSAPAAPQAKVHDGQHDFDFEIGTWKTHLRRRLHPLTGSTTWVEMDGTTICR